MFAILGHGSWGAQRPAVQPRLQGSINEAADSPGRP